MKKMCKILIGLVSLYSVIPLHAALNKSQKSMINDLRTIKQTFEIGYAPLEWKGHLLDWNIEEEYQKAKGRIASSPLMSIKEYRKVIKEFINSTQDCHVGVVFNSVERAFLPFMIKGVEGKYYIVWIDEHHEISSLLHANVGDEIISINDQPIEVLISKVKHSLGSYTNDASTQGMAEILLTYRLGMLGMNVPSGYANIKTRNNKSKKYEQSTLFWDYQPELIKDILPLQRSLGALFTKKVSSKNTKQMTKSKMINIVHERMIECEYQSPYDLGSAKGFLPPLGKIIWENDKSQNDNINWHAYIYKNQDGQQIGYIRIPHYMGYDEDSKEFGGLLNYLDQNTEALVIDQLNNPGGRLELCYQIVSMLIQNPILPPRHQMKITQTEVFFAVLYSHLLERLIEKLEEALEKAEELSDADFIELIHSACTNKKSLNIDLSENLIDELTQYLDELKIDDENSMRDDSKESDQEDSNSETREEITLLESSESESSLSESSLSESSLSESSLSESYKEESISENSDQSFDNEGEASQVEESETSHQEDESRSRKKKKRLAEIHAILERYKDTRDYHEEVINQWNQGKTLTDFIFIEGVTKIKPCSEYTYTKPILMLINEMDTSGGDFTPAMLQDAERVSLMGSRTAGAGGCVSNFFFPNANGISTISYTITLGKRTNHKKIENLGVTPDIPYSIKTDDIKNNYRSFIREINENVTSLINK